MLVAVPKMGFKFQFFKHISEPPSFIQKIIKISRTNVHIVFECRNYLIHSFLFAICQYMKLSYYLHKYPFVCLANSVKAVFELNGLSVLQLPTYKRYGLKNHIGLLKNAKPDGYTTVDEVDAGTAVANKSTIKVKRRADTILAIEEVA
jgi:hypothetical protein